MSDNGSTVVSSVQSRLATWLRALTLATELALCDTGVSTGSERGLM